MRRVVMGAGGSDRSCVRGARRCRARSSCPGVKAAAIGGRIGPRQKAGKETGHGECASGRRNRFAGLESPANRQARKPALPITGAGVGGCPPGGRNMFAGREAPANRQARKPALPITGAVGGKRGSLTRTAGETNRMVIMPTYEYVCAKCGLQFEKIQPISAKPLAVCPEELCGQTRWGKGKVKRAISAGGGLIFKGSGFY